MIFSLIQTSLYWLDPQKNLDHFEQWFTNIPEKCDVVVLPEMFSTGFYMRFDPSQLLSSDEILAWMRTHASKLDAAVVGSVAIHENGALYNRLFWVNPDGQYYTYDKRHLFRMAGEDRFFNEGKQRIVIRYKGLKCMPLICYDLRFPVWSRNDMNYDLLLYVANWPQKRISQWTKLLPARAIENQCYAIGLNRTGPDGNGVAYNGQSACWDYLGNPLNDINHEEGMISVQIDLSGLRQFREDFPAWKDRDRFHIEIDPS